VQSLRHTEIRGELKRSLKPVLRRQNIPVVVKRRLIKVHCADEGLFLSETHYCLFDVTLTNKVTISTTKYPIPFVYSLDSIDVR
jgi:hypothetical protein